MAYSKLINRSFISSLRVLMAMSGNSWRGGYVMNHSCTLLDFHTTTKISEARKIQALRSGIFSAPLKSCDIDLKAASLLQDRLPNPYYYSQQDVSETFLKIERKKKEDLLMCMSWCNQSVHATLAFFSSCCNRFPQIINPTLDLACFRVSEIKGGYQFAAVNDCRRSRLENLEERLVCAAGKPTPRQPESGVRRTHPH